MARVLVVDDDEGVVATLRAALESVGHTVSCEADGDAGLRALEGGTFDLVICDMLMPNADGIEFLRGRSDAARAIPVVAISGGGRMPTEVLLNLSVAFGAVKTLYKPFRRQELLALVEDVLRTRPAPSRAG
jgi:DNA-binding NtrC family response regulator